MLALPGMTTWDWHLEQDIDLQDPLIAQVCFGFRLQNGKKYEL